MYALSLSLSLSLSVPSWSRTVSAVSRIAAEDDWSLFHANISMPALCGYKLVTFLCSNCLPNRECLFLYISYDIKSAFFSAPAFLIHDLPKLNVLYTRMYFATYSGLHIVHPHYCYGQFTDCTTNHPSAALSISILSFQSPPNTMPQPQMIKESSGSWLQSVRQPNPHLDQVCNRACSLITTDFVCDVSVKTDVNQWAVWQPCCNTNEWLAAERGVRQWLWSM